MAKFIQSLFCRTVYWQKIPRRSGVLTHSKNYCSECEEQPFARIWPCGRTSLWFKKKPLQANGRKERKRTSTSLGSGHVWHDPWFEDSLPTRYDDGLDSSLTSNWLIGRDRPGKINARFGGRRICTRRQPDEFWSHEFQTWKKVSWRSLIVTSKEKFRWPKQGKKRQIFPLSTGRAVRQASYQSLKVFAYSSSWAEEARWEEGWRVLLWQVPDIPLRRLPLCVLSGHILLACSMAPMRRTLLSESFGQGFGSSGEFLCFALNRFQGFSCALIEVFWVFSQFACVEFLSTHWSVLWRRRVSHLCWALLKTLRRKAPQPERTATPRTHSASPRHLWFGCIDETASSTHSGESWMCMALKVEP